ncbi:MAG: hypothetical protein KA322_01595 [Chitinophagales bacterium]|jgi:hypothetical protein|nr:hypothetical protein [Chitinophagales bacterium]
MRKYLLILLNCLFLFSVSYSKEKDSTYKKNELNVFVGFFSWEQSLGIIGEGLFDFNSFIDTGYQVRPKVIHPIGISYKYYFSKKVCIKSSVSYARTRKLYSFTNPTSNYLRTDNIYSIMVGAEWHYFNKRLVSLYSGLEIGGFIWNTSVLNSENEKDRSTQGYLAFQINALGIRIGNQKIGGFVEIGLGNNGLVNTGLSVKF